MRPRPLHALQHPWALLVPAPPVASASAGQASTAGHRGHVSARRVRACLLRFDGRLDALRFVDRLLARLEGLGALLSGASASVGEGTSAQAIQLGEPVIAELVIGILGLAW